MTSGLQAGERIVVNGLQRVRPGALVAPQMVRMDAKRIGAGASRQRCGLPSADAAPQDLTRMPQWRQA